MARPSPTTDRRPPRPARRGRPAFTLAESLIASVVLALGVVGLSGTLAGSYQQTTALRQTATAVALGRQLLEEIAAKPLADPTTGSTATGPGPGETSRALFDNVGDYDRYTDASTAMPTLAGGSVDATGGEVYTRQVSVSLGASPTGDSTSPGTDFALVTVTVTTPAGQTVWLSRVVANSTFTR